MYYLKLFSFLVVVAAFFIIPCENAIARLSDITYGKNAAKIADAYGGGSDNRNDGALSAGHIIDTNKPDTSRDRLSALSYAKNSDHIDATYGNDRSRENSDAAYSGGRGLSESAYMKNSKKIDASFDENQNLKSNGGAQLNADNPSKSQSLYSSIFNGGK